MSGWDTNNHVMIIGISRHLKRVATISKHYHFLLVVIFSASCVYPDILYESECKFTQHIIVQKPLMHSMR